MNREVRIRVLIIIVLFVIGLIGASFDDPMEQLGILSLLISGFGVISTIVKLSKTEPKVAYKVFSIMASSICIILIFRILQWPFIVILPLSIIALTGLVGISTKYITNVIKNKKASRSDGYIIIGTAIITLFFIDYIFRLGITSANYVRIILNTFLLLMGIWVMNNGTQSVKYYPVQISIFMYAAFNLIAFVKFKLFSMI